MSAPKKVASAPATNNDVNNIEWTSTPRRPVISFLVANKANGGRLIDFQVNKGEAKRALLTVEVADEDGTRIEEIWASKDASKELTKRNSAKQSFEKMMNGMQVGEYYRTDIVSGEKTGEVGLMLCIATGDSVGFNSDLY